MSCFERLINEGGYLPRFFENTKQEHSLFSLVLHLRRRFGVFLFSSIDRSNLPILRLIFLFVCLFSEDEREQQTNQKMTLSWLLPRRLVTARVVIGRSFSAALSSSSSSSSATTTTTKTTSSTRLSYAESLPWATVDPLQLTGYDPNPYRIQNLCDGKWTGHEQQDRLDIPAPLDRNAPHALFSIPKTNETDELILFCQSLAKVPKSGLHNPLKDVHRYLEWGDIARKAGHVLSSPAGSDFFARCIQACVPKSYDQAMGEVRVTASFLNNFAGDNVRRLATSFGVPGDHVGQMSVGHRWPYGSVAVICPFNFPLEIPVLQVMGALFMGNKAVLKPSEPASVRTYVVVVVVVVVMVAYCAVLLLLAVPSNGGHMLVCIMYIYRESVCVLFLSIYCRGKPSKHFCLGTN